MTLFRLSTDIRKIPNDDKTEILEDGKTIYIHELKTKYYNTQIAFLPVEHTLNLTENSKENIEGTLVYFDSKDVSIVISRMIHTRYMVDNKNIDRG